MLAFVVSEGLGSANVDIRPPDFRPTVAQMDLSTWFRFWTKHHQNVFGGMEPQMRQMLIFVVSEGSGRAKCLYS